MRPRPGRARRGAAVLAGLLGAACQEQGPVVRVTVAGLPADAAALRVRAALDGRAAAEPRYLRRGLGRFDVQLAPGQAGRLRLEVNAIGADECSIAAGAAEAVVPPRASAGPRVDVALAALPAAACALAIEPYGIGAGQVVSEPAGIACPGRCSARFPLGTQVTLRAAADADSFFDGWQGGCRGRQDCVVAVPDAAVRVGAAFVPPPVCNAGRWCWYRPLPTGQFLGALWGDRQVLWIAADEQLLRWNGAFFGAMAAAGVDAYALWGRRRDEVWAVGKGGGVARWDGARWQRIPSGTTKDLYAVHGRGERELWIAGEDGVLLTSDGGAFRAVSSGGSDALYTLTGNAAGQLFVISGGVLLRDEGAGFAPMPGYPGRPPSSVWSGAPDVVFVQEGGDQAGPGRLFRWDGARWRDLGRQTNGGALTGSGPDNLWRFSGACERWDGARFVAVPCAGGQIVSRGFVAAADDIWVTTTGGAIWRWDGEAWRTLTSAYDSPPILALWGSGPDDIWGASLANVMYHFDGRAWSTMPSGTEFSLNAVWGSGPGDVWAVGDFGRISHYDGARWRRADSPVAVHLRGVWGRGPDDVWAVGEAGTILRLQGGRWSPSGSPTGRPLRGLWGHGAGALWAVGAGIILRGEGAAFRVAREEPSEDLVRVHGSDEDDVWAVGWGAGGPLLLRFTGAAWEPRPAPAAASLDTLWASGPRDVWFAGSDGQGEHGLWHWDGAGYQAYPLRVRQVFRTFHGSGPRDIWLGGGNSSGILLRYRP